MADHPEAAPVVDDADIEERRQPVDAAGHGWRLDRWLVRMAPEFSRTHLQGLIDAGEVRCDGAVARSASRRVSAGQVVDLRLVPTAESTAFRPEPIPLDVVWEDDALLVVHKPAGLVVHPAAGHWSGTLLNGLLARHPASAALPRAGIVHRLDKDTSGLMVVARSLAAQTALVRAIAAREVRREYLALAHGDWSGGPAALEAPIGRDPVSRVRMAVVGGGKPARTDVECLGSADWMPPASGARPARVSAFRCRLHTGRTHQIRVHLAHAGHPLVGDVLYGGLPVLGLQRQALHATRLALAHPLTGQALHWHAPLPADLAACWSALGLRDA